MASQVAPERWVQRPADRNGHVQLICVPYAGGSASVYHDWARLLSPEIEPWTLRLPGRDSRFRERAATDLLALANEAAGALAGLLEEPFAIFGHSLGAFVAFELARRLRTDAGLGPSLLAVSARNAPQIPTPRTSAHTLPDEDFLDVMDRQYGAIPPLIRDDMQMRNLFLPILRADVTLLETYEFRPGAPLECPVAVFGGTRDPETGSTGLAAWSDVTTGGCSVTMIEGDHFFLHSEMGRKTLLTKLDEDLLSTLIP